jgi:signal transduction histidine kinase
MGACPRYRAALIRRKEGLKSKSVTGCGISRQDLPHTFEPFFTTKTEGQGLGPKLSTVFGITERHKGTIHVESDVGNGTAFTVKLPVEKKLS